MTDSLKAQPKKRLVEAKDVGLELIDSDEAEKLLDRVYVAMIEYAHLLQQHGVIEQDKPNPHDAATSLIATVDLHTGGFGMTIKYTDVSSDAHTNP